VGRTLAPGCANRLGERRLADLSTAQQGDGGELRQAIEDEVDAPPGQHV
jgi:hypothetical protein